VEIGPDIDPDRISGERVTVHAGCKLYGPKTLIMPGVELGYEAPVTLHNCQLGRDVALKGGSFTASCFLEGAVMGSGAQVREACLLEEKARGGHTVGLKQTILFPYVTLGSLINFCDCLMAGGTDAENHSEVGSAYIHFNFTPHQDKATASLMGDVPRGVFLNRPPIFLGGQGGLVGPVRIAYGVVVAAGTIVRKDLLREGRILLGQASPSKDLPFHQGLYANVPRIIRLNTFYIGNLMALRRWYTDARSLFMTASSLEQCMLEGAVAVLDRAIDERIRRLAQVAERMPQSMERLRAITSGRGSEKILQRKQELSERWNNMERVFREGPDSETDPARKEAFLPILERAIQEQGRHYLSVISSLSESDTEAGTAWLQGIVDDLVERIAALLPSFDLTKG
jgi:UDP-N-acetylglucosamine/UDP-N-acetylgalactosamine diphosphorylase